MPGPVEGLGAALVAKQAEALAAELAALRETVASIPTLNECDVCGCLVGNTLAHDVWHERISELENGG